MSKTIITCLLFLLPATVWAAGDGFIYDFEGPVLINGKLASKQTPIHFGDEVLTGSRARISIKLDGNVYRVGHRSRLKLPNGEKNISLDLFFGSILAVFRHNTHKTIQTRTAVLGVRGTGIFLNVDNQKTYLCTCYGDIDFVDKADAEHVAHIHADHHNAIVFNHRSKEFQANQPLLGHESEELFALEALASRAPPSTFRPKNDARNSLEISAKK